MQKKSNKQIQGPRQPEISYFGSQNEELATHLQKHCHVDYIHPDSRKLGKKLKDYVSFRYRKVEASNTQVFHDKIEAALIDRMVKIPMRLSILRYDGADLSIGGETPFKLKKGDVIGCHTAKQTMIYPESYFESLRAASNNYPMDDLTKAVMTNKPPHPFRYFQQIEELPEGPLKTGGGAMFLLVADIHENLRQKGLSKILLGESLKAYQREGIPFAFVYGRIPSLHADEQAQKQFREDGKVEANTLNQILQEIVDGKTRDSGVNLHIAENSRIICGLPDSVIDDKSLNCGFLAIYDLRKTSKGKSE